MFPSYRNESLDLRSMGFILGANQVTGFYMMERWSLKCLSLDKNDLINTHFVHDFWWFNWLEKYFGIWWLNNESKKLYFRPYLVGRQGDEKVQLITTCKVGKTEQFYNDIEFWSVNSGSRLPLTHFWPMCRNNGAIV